MNLFNFVCEQIELSNKLSHIDQKGAWIFCPYHGGGQEKTASLLANIYDNGFVAGSFYCFACSEKGNWNKLAEKLGLRPFSIDHKVTGVTGFSLSGIGEQKRKLIPNLSKMLKWPSATYWRNISPATITRVQGRLSKSRNEFCLYLPCIINEDHVGGIYASLDGVITKNWKSKYLNTPGNWSHSSLFGYDIAAEKSSILWVVEGPRDCLSLLDKGCSAVALLGSAVTSEKIKLITSLDPDIILIATDSDEAGNKASESIKHNLKGKIPCKRIQMESGTDPADLTLKQVRYVERYANKLLGG